MISTQQLLYYVRTVEVGSLNQSAKSLYISQPALSKQLTQLESILNCNLLIRKPTGITITEAGRLFYDRARFILDQLDSTVQQMKSYQVQEEIRIGALPSIASYLLPKLIEQSRIDANHRITITVRDTTQELLNLIKDKTLDIAFVQDLERVEEETIHSLPLFSEPYFAVLHTTHRLAGSTSLNFSNILQERLILHKDPCDIRTSFRRLCSQLGQEAHAVLELDFNESILTFVAVGSGMSIVPKMVADHIQDSAILSKPIADRTFTRTICLIYADLFHKNMISNWINRIVATFKAGAKKD